MRKFEFSNFQQLDRLIVDQFGVKYRTVEHAYQAAKSLDPEIRRKIAACPTPAKAKALGRRIQQRPDWNQVKVEVMEKLLRAKFGPGTVYRKLLLRFEGDLVERNWWHNNFWGVCTCGRCSGGLNKLGELVAKIRSEILKEGD